MDDIEIKAPLIDFTPVDNTFIDEYLKDARGDFVRVYLFCLRQGYRLERTNIQKIASSLNLLQADVLAAFEYWENAGVMKLSSQGLIEISAIRKNKAEEHPVYFDKPIKEMFDDLEKLIGRPLSSKEVSVYMDMVEDFGFSPEIIALLVEYCSSRKKTDIRYIEKVSIAWHDSGIRTIEDAQNYITKHEDKWNRYRSILNFMGFKDAEISKPQEEFLEKWLFKYNLPVEVIQEAVRICTMRINESNFSYIDAILSDWNKNGVKDVADVKKNDKKTRSSKKTPANSFGSYSGQRQYDIKELKKQLLGRGDADDE